MKVFSKVCSVFDNKKKKRPPPPHECPNNWWESSSAMEPQEAPDIWLGIHNRLAGNVYWEHSN